MASIFGLIQLFIYFYIGQKFHTNLIELSDAIYQVNWHQYPLKVRRFVQLLILRSQRPFYLSAYGVMELNLMNYVKVTFELSIAHLITHGPILQFQLLKWVYSSFTLLRSME